MIFWKQFVDLLVNILTQQIIVRSFVSIVMTKWLSVSTFSASFWGAQCAVPPDHLRSEISFSRTCNIPKFDIVCISRVTSCVSTSAVNPGGGRAIVPRKTYESNIFHHDFVQFGKQHSRYKAHLDPHCFVTAVLWSILHVAYSSELVMRLDCKILLKSLPLNLLAGSALGLHGCAIASSLKQILLSVRFSQREKWTCSS